MTNNQPPKQTNIQTNGNRQAALSCEHPHVRRNLKDAAYLAILYGGFQKLGALLRGPCNKDHNGFGSMSESLIFGNSYILKELRPVTRPKGGKAPQYGPLKTALRQHRNYSWLDLGLVGNLPRHPPPPRSRLL